MSVLVMKPYPSLPMSEMRVRIMHTIMPFDLLAMMLPKPVTKLQLYLSEFAFQFASPLLPQSIP